jgi:putative flippase GtrA
MMSEGRLGDPRKERDPMRFLRSLLAGGAATVADLAVLALCTSALGLSPRVSSIPALIAGGIVNFLGNRHFAFRAADAALGRQAVQFLVVEFGTLLANGLLYDLALRALPRNVASGAYVLVRLATSNAVFLAWSYPLWRLVFRVPAPGMNGMNPKARSWSASPPSAD